MGGLTRCNEARRLHFNTLYCIKEKLRATFFFETEPGGVSAHTQDEQR